MPGAVGGRIDPLVVALPVGASYSTVLPMQRLVSLEARARSLESLVTVQERVMGGIGHCRWRLSSLWSSQPQHDRLLHGKLVSAP